MMLWEYIRFALCALCMLGGLVTLVSSIVGLFKLDFSMNRIHAAAMADTLSLLLFLLGVFIAIGFTAAAWKLLLILLVQWFTAPLSSHMLADFEYQTDEDLADYLDLSDDRIQEVDA